MYLLTNISRDADGRVYAGFPTAFETIEAAVESAKEQLADDFGINKDDIDNDAQEGGTPYVLSMSRDGRFEAYTVADIPNTVKNSHNLINTTDNESRIGIKGYFYIEVTFDSGNVVVYAKNGMPLAWRKIGYTTLPKAIRALKRMKKRDREDYPDNHHKYRIIEGGDGGCVHDETQ